jgi:hypothetical protein
MCALGHGARLDAQVSNPDGRQFVGDDIKAFYSLSGRVPKPDSTKVYEIENLRENGQLLNVTLDGVQPDADGWSQQLKYDYRGKKRTEVFCGRDRAELDRAVAERVRELKREGKRKGCAREIHPQTQRSIR